MRLSVVFKEKRDKFFLIKQFHLIEKKTNENKHCLLLEKFSLFFDKSEPVSTPAPTALFFPFSFHDFAWARDLFHEAAKRMQNGKGKRPHQQCYILFRKCHRNSLRIWPGNPMNASGTSREHIASQSYLAGPCGATFHLSALLLLLFVILNGSI